MDQFCSDHLFADQFTDLKDRVVLIVGTDIVDLICDRIQWCFQNGCDRSSGVLDVYEWSPLVAAENGDLAVDLGLGGQQVHHQVEPSPSG